MNYICNVLAFLELSLFFIISTTQEDQQFISINYNDDFTKCSLTSKKSIPFGGPVHRLQVSTLQDCENVCLHELDGTPCISAVFSPARNECLFYDFRISDGGNQDRIILIDNPDDPDALVYIEIRDIADCPRSSTTSTTAVTPTTAIIHTTTTTTTTTTTLPTTMTIPISSATITTTTATTIPISSSTFQSTTSRIPNTPSEEPSQREPTPTAVDLDKNSNCCRWAQEGECENDPIWMKTNCQTSCGTPGVTEDDLADPLKATRVVSNPPISCKPHGRGRMRCEDKDTQCRQWATAGDCSRDPFKVKLACPLSCQICPSSYAPPSGLNVENVCGTSKENSYCGSKNLHLMCNYWSFKGHCLTYARERILFMKTNCCPACEVGSRKLFATCK